MDFEISGLNNPDHLQALACIYGWIVHNPQQGRLIYGARLFDVAETHYHSCAECQMLLHQSGGDIPPMTAEEGEATLKSFFDKHPDRKRQNDLVMEIERMGEDATLVTQAATRGTVQEQFNNAMAAVGQTRCSYETALLLQVHLAAL